MSSEGFPALEKNAVICPQSRVLPILSGIPASNDCLAHNFFKFELAGSGLVAHCRLEWLLAQFKFVKGALNGHYYLHRASTPNQITHQNSLQRAGGP